MTHHPQINLLKSRPPPCLIFFHPTSIGENVRHVYDQSRQIIANNHTAVTPVSFDPLRLVTDSPEVIYGLQDSFSKQLAGHVTSIIELKWEQDLESPPLVAHMWSFQLQRMGCSDQRVLPVRLQGQDVHQ